MTTAQLTQRLHELELQCQMLSKESAKHRRGKRYWKEYARQLEAKLADVYNNR